jgi:hypothetical protein
VEQLARATNGPVKLFVKREFYIAGYYAPENISVYDFRRKVVQPGDFVLLHSRANPGLQVLKDTSPYFLRVERDGAIFCEIQRQ